MDMKKVLFIISIVLASFVEIAAIVYMYQKDATIRIMIIFAVIVLIGNVLAVVANIRKRKSLDLMAGGCYFTAVIALLLKYDESMMDPFDLVVYALGIVAAMCGEIYRNEKEKRAKK